VRGEKEKEKMMKYSMSDSRNNELSLIHSSCFFFSFSLFHFIIKSTPSLSDPQASLLKMKVILNELIIQQQQPPTRVKGK